MKNKILIMLFALILLPFGGQGQTILQPNANVSISNGIIEINEPGRYTISGYDESSQSSILINCDSQNPIDLYIDNLKIVVKQNKAEISSPINIVKGNVNLRLRGDNELIRKYTHNPGIQVSENSSLTIFDEDKGSLVAEGSEYAPGIGCIAGGRSKKSGNITIKGGRITAKAKNAPAIGCSALGSISNITIEGGFITAISSTITPTYNSTIGGHSDSPEGGEITIRGGTVLTINSYGGRGSIGSIGISSRESPTKVIIYGGSVQYDPNISPVNNKDEKVYLKTICGLKADTKLAALEGVKYLPLETYVDTNGKLYLWLPKNSKVSSIHAYDLKFQDGTPERDQYYYNQSLIIKRNGELWNDHGITFTVKKDDKGDPIECSDNDFYLENGNYTLYADRININNPISISGTSPDNITLDYYSVTYDLNEGDNNSSIPKPTNCLKGTTVTVDNTVIPTREHYTFMGWGLNDKATDKDKVKSIDDLKEATTLYAIWKPNEFSVNTAGKPQELTYKKDMSLDLSTLLASDAVTNCGDITFNIDNGSSLPAGLKLESSIITGAPEAVTEQDITTSITATAANTFSCQFDIEFSVAKANATIANIDISAEGYTYSGKAIEIAPPKVIGATSDNLDATLTYYTSYKDENTNTKTTIADSGADLEGGAPVYAGNYTVVASFAGNDHYNKAIGQPATFNIKQKELTVTPVSNQIIYEGDKILYNVTGEVNKEVPEFEGALNADKGIIIQDNNFKLKAPFSKNYSFKFTSDIGVTVHNGNASDAVATMNAKEGQNDWFTSDVTITPPADFKIELVLAEPLATLKSNDTHKETLVWDMEGAHTLSYTLHRQSRDGSYPHDLSLKLDKTPPTLKASVDNENYTLTFSDGNAGSGIDKLLVDDKEVSNFDASAPYTGTASAGKHKAKVFDKAGLSCEIEFTLTKKPDNPDPNPGPKPDPDPGPMPTPTRYDVTLTDTTGIIYTPAAGKYKVDAWGKFDFSIEVAKGYTMFSDPIVYVNNVKLPSKDSKGNYSINPVREDKVVKVTGIVSDLSTANEAINTPDRRITVVGKTIYIDVPDRAVFHLFDITGSHKLSRQLHPGTNRIDVDPGSYIGRIDNEKEGKVIIVK